MIYDIAGLRINIKNRYEFTDKFCRRWLSDNQKDDFDIEVFATDEDIETEKKQSENFPIGYIENICIYRNLCSVLPVRNRFLLHSAIIEYEGNGYAFLGHSGAGKSTHTGLWLKYLTGSKIVNGDKPIIEFDGKNFIGYGTPWLGKEGRGCNSSCIIKGICFVEKAKENRIEKISAEETANRLFSQILIPTEASNAGKTLELADEFVKTVPSYVLYCDISENAVKTSYEALSNKKYNQTGRKHED